MPINIVYCPPALQPCLDQFVQQFELCGCALIWSDRPSPSAAESLQWLGCYSRGQMECPDHELRQQLEAAIALAQWQQSHPLEVIALPTANPSFPFQVYGCWWSHATSERNYLLCWHTIAFSEHQSYGMQLYAQALTAMLVTETEACSLKMHKVLQQSRHQLRTPLSLISLYAELLQTVASDSQSQQWVQNLRSTIEEMHISLNHLTELTPVKLLVSVDLRQLIIQCIQGLQPWIDQKQLTVMYDSQPLWVQVDEWKIRQVFQNLLSNAIAFAPSGGYITWEWQSFQAEVLIKIRDNGPGLSAEDLRFIGTPFYSRRPGGTGLGLSIARQIVSDHHGSLWGDNLPDGGAQFCVTLPKCS